MNNLIEVGQRVKLLPHSEFATDNAYNPVGVPGTVVAKYGEWLDVKWSTHTVDDWNGVNSYLQSADDLEVIND